MDGFNFFCCIQFLLVIGGCLAIVYRRKLIAFEDRIRERFVRRRYYRSAKWLESVGVKIVPPPAMNSKDVILLMKEY